MNAAAAGVAQPRSGTSASQCLDDYLRRQVPPFSTNSPSSVPIAVVQRCTKPIEQQSNWEKRDDVIDEHLDSGSRNDEHIHTAYHEQMVNELTDIHAPFKDRHAEGVDASDDWIERLNGRRRQREMLYPRAADLLRHGAFNEWSRTTTSRSRAGRSSGGGMRAATDRISSRLVSFLDEYRDGLEASWYLQPDKSEALEFSSSPESMSSGSERRYAERRARRQRRRKYSATKSTTAGDDEDDDHRTRFRHRACCQNSCVHCHSSSQSSERPDGACVCSERQTISHRVTESSHGRMETLLQQVVQLMLLKEEKRSGRTRPRMGATSRTRRMFTSSESSSDCSCSQSSSRRSSRSSMCSSSNNSNRSSSSAHQSTKRTKKGRSSARVFEQSTADMREARHEQTPSSSNRGRFRSIHQGSPEARAGSSEKTPCSGCELCKLEIQRLKQKLVERQQPSSNHDVQRTCRCDERTSTGENRESVSTPRTDRGVGADVDNGSALGLQRAESARPMMDLEYRPRPNRRRRSRYRFDSANAVGDDDVDDILDRQEHRMNSFIRRRLHAAGDRS